MIAKDLKTDSKNRISLSKKDRRDLGNTKTVIVRIEKGKLSLYNPEEWSRVANEGMLGLRGLSLRRAKRNFFGSSFLQDIDRAGRVLIPNLLKERYQNENRCQ